MRPFNKGFASSYGIEDVWNTVVAVSWFNRTDRSARLSQLFGPYVPIFAEFLKPWRLNTPYPYRYPFGFVQTLRRVLRKGVPYVAVSQNAEGIMGLAGQFRMSDFPSVLVLSAGGYGHVALPLFHTAGKDISWIQKSVEDSMTKQAKREPVGRRKYFVSFVGTMGHSPRNMRQEMKNVSEDFLKSHDTRGRGVAFEHFSGPGSAVQWESIMFQSRFSLVPRGYGRTAFHLVEAIHRGLIPVYIYLDQPWLPYPHLYETFGYSTGISDLPRLLKKLNAMTDDEITAGESAVAAFARSHFTDEAVIEQMKAFLLGGPTDLVCQKLPESVTGKGTNNSAGVWAQ
uniref:Exostosin GT47 domain-containing protein n=1 Tax=Alexandrium catenella TaxID=2925 RepID=A0A7S1RN74_ALECA